MKDLIVFAGTSEGRLLYDFCAEHKMAALFCVATDYGRETLETRNVERCRAAETWNVEPDRASGTRNDKLCKLEHRPEIRTGRLDREEMAALFRREQPRLVIDATHPYAVLATENIRAAALRYAKEAGSGEDVYCRVRRETGAAAAEERGAERFADMARAVAYLNGTRGNVLVTTGSKDVDELCKLKDYAGRAYVRILPHPEILRCFLDRGFAPAHMLCMQGPFTEETNLALLRQYDIRYLLTKRSGAAGGYPEKCRAAQVAGVKLLVVLPPDEDGEGCSVEEARELIRRRLRVRT